MTSRIADGGTALLGIIGDPIRQVRAPEVWSAMFRTNGVNALCVPLHVPASGLAEVIGGLQKILNLAGIIVTIPHKPAAAGIADCLTERAALVRAVNVMRLDRDGRWTGDILDGVGFVHGLLDSGQRVAGRRAFVFGSGGVGSAIAFALAAERVASVHVADLNQARAAELARRLTAAGTPSGVAACAMAEFDLLVNASPLGMKPDDQIPFDCAGLSVGTIVGDVVAYPADTKLLQAARHAGCHTQSGTVMMERQLSEMQAFFRFPQGDYSPAAIARALSRGG